MHNFIKSQFLLKTHYEILSVLHIKTCLSHGKWQTLDKSCRALIQMFLKSRFMGWIIKSLKGYSLHLILLSAILNISLGIQNEKETIYFRGYRLKMWSKPVSHVWAPQLQCVKMCCPLPSSPRPVSVGLKMWRSFVAWSHNVKKIGSSNHYWHM